MSARAPMMFQVLRQGNFGVVTLMYGSFDFRQRPVLHY